MSTILLAYKKQKTFLHTSTMKKPQYYQINLLEKGTKHTWTVCAYNKAEAIQTITELVPNLSKILGVYLAPMFD